MNKTDKEIIKKINELYISNRKKYLVLTKKGKYFTRIATNEKNKNENIVFGEKDITKKKHVPMLNDGYIAQHLKGTSTYGVFNGQYVGKFLCFDVDTKNNQLARWITYRIINSLIEIGIPGDKIYPSISGSKGFHIEIFFKQYISNKALYTLYCLTLEYAGLEKTENYTYSYQENTHNVNVEFRPNENKNGVKIPLGKHFNTKGHKRCWYVDRLTLKEIRSQKYILGIEQINNEILYNILDCEKDLITIDEQKAMDIEETKQFIDESYKPLKVYNQNIDENETIEAIQKLEQEGLKYQGTRHKALLKLAKYYKWQGMNQTDNEETLTLWMGEQDTRSYNTIWNDCIKDIKEIVKYIYDNDVSLTIEQKDIEVTYEEMLQILDFSKRSQKLIVYSMLIHSKRFANKIGVFYMTQQQMAESTGYDIRTVQRELPILAELKAFEYISRNIEIKGIKGKYKKPNRYKMLITNSNPSNNSYIIEVNGINEYQASFNQSLMSLLDTYELKQKLPRRHFEEIRNCK